MDLKSLSSKNYYEMLGLSTDATFERIREVYRDLAKVYHPDSNFYDEIIPEEVSPEQVAVFKVITAAYNTLIDQEKRAEYDKYLESITLSHKVKTWDSQEEEIARRSGCLHSRPRMDGFGKQIFVSEEPIPQLRPRANQGQFKAAWLLATGLLCGALIGCLVAVLV